MKSTDFKKLIKQAVKEAIQEELKEILLEAVRTPKTPVGIGGYGAVTENNSISKSISPQSSIDLRSKYADILGETALSFTSNDVQPFRPQVSDPVNGNLGTGEVGMDQIMNLLNTK